MDIKQKPMSGIGTTKDQNRDPSEEECEREFEGEEEEEEDELFRKRGENCGIFIQKPKNLKALRIYYFCIYFFFAIMI